VNGHEDNSRTAIDLAATSTSTVNRMTTINVLDTYTQTRRILEAKPVERAALLEAMYEPAAGMYGHLPKPIDVASMHAFGSGFPLDRNVNRSLEGLEMLAAADTWGRIESALDRGLAVLRQSLTGANFPEKITVIVVLDDPDDNHLVEINRGYTAAGGISGFIHLGIWPTAENLERLEGIAVHELHHNVRYSNVRWNPATVTVGEQVVSEGLADAFARDLYGELGLTLIGVASAGDAAVFEKVVSGLNVSGMRNLAPWVHGDATAARFGAEPVGLPTGAGYAAGLELVDRYQRASGRSAAEACVIDAEELIAITLGRRTPDSHD
jgi:uncharacterized protein YjaZ